MHTVTSPPQPTPGEESAPSPLLRETQIFLLDLPRYGPRGPGGRPIHYTTALRWAVRGVQGVRLEAVRLGGRWVTSLEALGRFSARVTAAASHTPTDVQSPGGRQGGAA